MKKTLIPMLLLMTMATWAQETKIPWGAIDKLTTLADIPGVKMDSPQASQFSLDVIGGSQWKSMITFQHDSVTKSEFGVDYSGDGTNRFFFYGGVTPYVAIWPAAQGAANSCLGNDGSGNLTWVGCIGADLWTEGTGEIHPTTAANHVQIGGGAAVSELRLLEPSGAGTNYTGWSAPSSLAGNIVYDMPTADGTANYCLQTNADGTTKWGPCVFKVVTGTPTSLTLLHTEDFEAYTVDTNLPTPPYDANNWNSEVMRFCATNPADDGNCGKVSNDLVHGGAQSYWAWGLDFRGLNGRYAGYDEIHYSISTYPGFQYFDHSFWVNAENADWTDGTYYSFYGLWYTQSGSGATKMLLITLKPNNGVAWSIGTENNATSATPFGAHATGQSLSTGWHQFTYKITTVKWELYLDGVLIDTIVWSTEIPTGLSNNRIYHYQVTPDIYIDDITTSAYYNNPAYTNYIDVGDPAGVTELRFLEDPANGTNYVGFKAPSSIASNLIWTLPSADGTANQAFLTSGAGVISFGTPWVTTGGGWTDDGTVVRLITATDAVAIGANTVNSTGATVYVTKSATTAIGADLWLTNSGVNALASSARLAFGSDATADTTPNWGIESPMVNVAGYRADLVFKAYDASSYAQKLRLINVSSTQYALVLGTGAVANLCCGDSFAIQGPYDGHQNVTQTFYRAAGTTLGAAISLIGTTAGDWVTSTVQNDFIIRSQSTLYLSGGSNGYKGYKLTETTHDWYVSDTATAGVVSGQFQMVAGSVGTPSYSFKTDTNSGMYSGGSDVVVLDSGGIATFEMGPTANRTYFNLRGRATGSTNWDSGVVISCLNPSNTARACSFSAAQIGAYSGISGTEGAPFYTWEDDPDTGIYRPGANNMAITIGGSLRVDIEDTMVKFRSGATATSLRLFEPSGSGTNYAGIKAPAMAADVTWILPNADSSLTQCMKSDGSGNLGWQSCLSSVDIQRYGFMNQTETTIAFDGTSIFTLGDAGSGWSYYRTGIKYTISGNKTIDLLTVENPLVDGRTYFIYIDGTSGTLVGSTSTWTLLDTKVPVATVKWNNTLTPKYWLAEERHSILIDRRTHYYEHTSEGAKLASRGATAGATIDTDTNAAKTFSIQTTTLNDEDIVQTLATLNDPDGTATDYVVFYRTAASTWVWKVSNMPFVYNSGTNWIQWDNGGTMTDATGGGGANERWLNSYVMASNYQGAARYVIIPGRAIFTSLAAAQAEAWSSFDMTGFPFEEAVFMYRVTWRTPNGLTSQGQCEMAQLPVAISGSSLSVSGISMAHNSLSGLNGGTTGEYYHLTSAEYTGTGTGNFVRASTPTITTPSIGTGLTIGGSATSGTILRGNGTNYVPSATTYLDTWTANGILFASGVNTVTNSPNLTWTASGLISTASLTAGTGDEIAYTLNYTVNKASSGNDTGLALLMTDTASPGTSYFARAQVGAVEYLRAGANGYLEWLHDGDGGIIDYRNSDDTTGGLFQARKARGTTAAPTAALSGDVVGSLNFLPYHTDVSASWTTTASTYAYLLENCTHAACGTGYSISLSPIGSSSTATVINWADGGKMTSTAILDNDTGNEVAFTLNYTTNKASSGNDVGLNIVQTDTASPGTSNLLQAYVGSSAVAILGNTGVLNLYSDVSPGLVMYRYSDNTGSPQLQGRKARGTQASPTAALSGDTMFTFSGYSYHTDVSAAFDESVAIIAQLTENATHTTNGSQWLFYTTPNTTETPRISMIVGQDSSVTFGYTTDFDPIRIAPVAKGANAYVGTITSSDLTAARTWTLQNGDGTIYQSGGTDVAVADGGTGLSSWTANGIVYASGTTTLANSGKLVTDGATYVSQYRNADDANPPVHYFFKSRGTLASPTATSSGDYLMDISGHNYHTDTSAAYIIGASIAMKATENSTHAATGTQIEFYATTTGTTGKALKMTVLNGVIIGAPTGSFKGDGTINAAADIYKNNSAYANPDYVFEKAYTGNIVRYAGNEGASTYRGLRSIDDMEKFTKENLHLPLIDRQPAGAFARSDMILLSMEEAYLYIFELNKRITELEKKLKKEKQ